MTVDLLFYLFALPRDGAEEVRDNAVLMVQTDAKTRQKSEAHLAAFRWMADYAENLVQERKKNPGDDLLSNFITAEIDGEKLLDKEVQLTVTTLIMAGIESLSGFMGMFALNLADFADARRALVADPSLIPDALEESLRFNTSGPAFQALHHAGYRAARPDHEGRRFRHAGLWRGQPRRTHVHRSRLL